jgi:sugar lactone lactonase YvrE
VAVSGNYIFVSDPNVGGIQIFNSNGTPIGWFRAYDSDGWGLDNEVNEYPLGMKADNKGHLYVADADEGTVDVYNVNDVIAQTAQAGGCVPLINAFVSYGNSGLSDLSNDGVCPEDVDVDNNGNIYVADPCFNGAYVYSPVINADTVNDPNDRFNAGSIVIAYSQSGSVSVNNGSVSSPNGIAVDPTGEHVYLADTENNVIQLYNGQLSSTGYIGNASGAAGTLAGQFDYPLGVRVDNQGNLLVADTDNARVQRLSPSGQLLNMIGTPNYNQGQLYSPTGLAVDSGNNLYVTDPNVATVDVYSAQ